VPAIRSRGTQKLPPSHGGAPSRRHEDGGGAPATGGCCGEEGRGKEGPSWVPGLVPFFIPPKLNLDRRIKGFRGAWFGAELGHFAGPG